jgi:lactoylglutathione lyase
MKQRSHPPAGCAHTAYSAVATTFSSLRARADISNGRLNFDEGRAIEDSAMIKKLLHTRYRVTDLEKTVAFYRDVLGLKEVRRHTSGRGSQLVFFKAPQSEEEIEICKFDESGPVVVGPDLTHLAFEVDSIEQFARDAAAKGYPLSDGPHRNPNGGAIAFIDAPEGYEIELIERAAG